MRFSTLFALPLLIATPAKAWGPIGHRITGDRQSKSRRVGWATSTS